MKSGRDGDTTERGVLYGYVIRMACAMCHAGLSASSPAGYTGAAADVAIAASRGVCISSWLKSCKRASACYI